MCFIGVVDLPLLSSSCMLLVLLSCGTLVSGGSDDPCVFAADPEQCHYDQAKALLAQLSPQQGALMEVDQAVRPAARATTAESSESDDLNAGDRAPDGGSLSKTENQELKTMVLKQALDVLEGEAPASASLENATLQLEQQLEDIEPGAVEAFRSQHLAAAMNSQGPHPKPRLRAAVAARLLSGAEWDGQGNVAGAISKLENVALNDQKQAIQPDVYLCSKHGCSMFGCGTGADPSNEECDPLGKDKCADGHGTCRPEKGKVLDGTFKIEVMAEPGHFLYLPDWDDSDTISAISPAKHKKGDPGAKGHWYVVLNADGSIMLYTKEFGPEYWLSIEEHAGKKLLAYRGFTSPVAASFTVHTNKDEDELYVRDVPFKYYITDSGDGDFRPDPVLDKKAATLKFHPPLPDEVKIIADSAYCMSVVPVILLCIGLHL
jgi:hypothetical protein